MIWIKIFAFLLVLAPNPSFAQTSRIAIVDIEKISSQSLAGQSIQTQLKDRRAAYQKEFSARENNLMNAEKLLIEQQNTLSTEDFAEKRKDFETQLSETRNLFQKRRRALDQGMGRAVAELRKAIIQVVTDIADRDGYNVVLTRESVVIVQTEMDITDQVMTLLNERLPTISLVIKE